MKILHITDSYNAGVKVAIDFIAKNNSSDFHFLLWSAHSDTPEFPENYQNIYAQTIHWEGNYFFKIIKMIRIAKKLSPDVIHLHSSVAGFLGRIFLQRFFIIYSSHCFAFQRMDLSVISKNIFILIEMILDKITDVQGFSWPIEEKIIDKYFYDSKKIFFPIFNIEDIEHANLSNEYESNTIVSTGRIRPQKDPLFFIDTLSKISTPAKCTWYGTGDKSLILALKNAGVTVTGWTNDTQLRKQLPFFSVNVITSAWESGPLTLIESISIGTPVICRSIEAIDVYGFQTFISSTDLALALDKVLLNSDYRKYVFDEQKQLIIKYFKPLYISNINNYMSVR